ncbi:MAG: hypothetical protein F9K29_00435 [Hyphomicrobiaceae bacterium]|nr:MAG: hypothetical protein F9K29_00435 [Hyphomicrobiaceae bacterium]
MDVLNALKLRIGAGRPAPTSNYWDTPGLAADEPEGRDPRKLFLVVGLGALSWVATYVGMLELIEANMGDLPLVHKIIVAFSVAMLMTMIIWLLDKMFSPIDGFTRLCYITGYIFLSVISVGFGFGFYWKVLESRGEASRSAESAITQVQTSLFAASTRLEQLQSTLDQLTAVSTEKADVERASGKSCPNSGPGDGPRRKMREEDASRFKFASDFVKGRVGTVKGDMAALDGDLQKIVKDDRSVIDPRTGNRNEFLRGVGRKLDLTVTGFNAFRTDPQLKQIRADLADRAEKTTIASAKGVVISCPDPQLQMALRGVVRAIDQLPELEKPKIAAVEGSEATIEAFRRLTTTFFGLMTFKMPPSADELRELQKRAVQSVEMSGQSPASGQRLAYVEQGAGLAKRDYVPLAVAIFVDLCLLLVSIGRPVNRFVGAHKSMREAESGPVYPILSRFHDTHGHADVVKYFEVFRDVIFEVNGHYHVAVPLNIPKSAENRGELRREAQTLANLCYALEGQGILARPISFLPPLLAYRQLRRRGSKFVECYGNRRSPHLLRGWQAIRSVWSEMPRAERPAFKVYRFKKGAWPEMILGAVMGAARRVEAERVRLAREEPPTPRDPFKANGSGGAASLRFPGSAWAMPSAQPEAEAHEAAFGRYAHYVRPQPAPAGPAGMAEVNGQALHGTANGSQTTNTGGAGARTAVPQTAANGNAAPPQTREAPPRMIVLPGPLPVPPSPTPAAPAPKREATISVPVSDAHIPASLKDALRRLPGENPQPPKVAALPEKRPQVGIEIEKISGWFGRVKKDS